MCRDRKLVSIGVHHELKTACHHDVVKFKVENKFVTTYSWSIQVYVATLTIDGKLQTTGLLSCTLKERKMRSSQDFTTYSLGHTVCCAWYDI